MSELKPQVKRNLKAIREVLDLDVSDTVIEDVVTKMHKLINLVGLASESKATARKILEEKRLVQLSEIKDSKYPPTVLLKIVDANCADELALYEYADRINASISHSLDSLRTIISLRKEEMRLEISNSYMQS
jgi:hypothetical protein